MTEASELTAWLVLRAVYAWMYVYPAIGLLRDWPTTVKTTGLLFPRATPLFAAASVAVMIVGGLMILFGAYGQYAAIALLAFNLGGARIHFRLAAAARATPLPDDVPPDERASLDGLVELAEVGHVTSAQKNYVLAAVAVFFALMGTGPWSVIPSAGVF